MMSSPSPLPSVLSRGEDFPNSSIREGFRDISLGTAKAHPVQQIQAQSLRSEEAMKIRRTGLVYGMHAAVTMRMERELLSGSGRLPGLKSSLLGLHTIMGADSTIDMHDYVGIDMPVSKTDSVHEIIEAKLL
eukprot:GHVS01080156.1.p1 GENE.GHVS01080156.1~~GHVS01080156.1.p1  ORF type:complete len:132 (-),score=25.79 GHVS01080156.1:332-727(-)